ncbi:MAG: ABC transporter substrate-binding protein [Candidatus Dormibacteraeota bacterium]|nr:ABC transporter substrate-binding protein [Candidatus Dormibacteraeota bacterium]
MIRPNPAIRNLMRRPFIATIATVLLVAACGGTTSSGGGLGSGALLVGVIAPFTNIDAVLGPAYYAACLPASLSINNNGGIGGRMVSCSKFDTRGEPADAVPAANAMIASNSNLMAVVGCTSDEAATVAPIIDRAHIPMFCMTGQTEFNKTQFKYFHRLVPADIFDAYAMVGNALYGPNHPPYMKAALVFGNDIGSQAFVQPATNAFTKLGGQITINQPISLTPGTSYRTEVNKMLATHPDVIFTEALGAAGTYLKEVKTQNGGMIPFIGTSATIDPQWFQQVKDAIGIADLLKYYGGVDLGYSFSGPAYSEFLTNLNASVDKMPEAPKYKQRGSTLHLYDGIIMTALAMVATNSADPTVYNPKIKEIANGTSGATVVTTYKDGGAALKAGKTIRFVGAGGENNFDQYNNSVSGYILVTYDAQGNEVKLGQLTPDQTAKISAAGGI